VGLQEAAVVRVQQVGVGDHGVLMIAHEAGGGVVGEQVVHRGGHFEGAFVAVAAGGGEPFGVDHAGAHDAGDLLFQAADARAGGVVVVAVIDGRGPFAEDGAGGGHAPLELVVVVGVA